MTHGKTVIEDRTYGIATSDTAALKEMMMNKLESKKYIPE
jgi:hypothetical protein